MMKRKPGYISQWAVFLFFSMLGCSLPGTWTAWAEDLQAVHGNELTRDLFTYTRLSGAQNVQIKINVQTEGLASPASQDDPALIYYNNKYPVSAEDRYGLYQDPGPYLLVTGYQKQGQKVTIRIQSTPPTEFNLPDSGHPDIATRYRITRLSYGFLQVMMTGETEAYPEELVGLTKDQDGGVISWTPSPVTRASHSYVAAPVIMDLTVSYRVEEEMFKVADGSSYTPPQSNVWTKRIARLVLPICGNELDGQLLLCPDETETWRVQTRGDLSLAIPKNWLEESGAPPDQGAWYLGERSSPEMSLLLIREDSIDEILGMMEVEKTEEITIAGRKAQVHLGMHKNNKTRAELIAFEQKGTDGKVIILGVMGSKWDEHQKTLEQILQSISFGSEATLPASVASQPQVAAASAPAPAPAPGPPGEEKNGVLSLQEQEELAATLFQQMIDTPNDQLDTFAKLYREVIEKCPQSSRVEESYWRLSNLYILGFDPPRQQEAQALLEDFVQKFPTSDRLIDIHHRLVVIYEETQQWCKAAELYSAMEAGGTGYPDYQASSVNLLHGEALEKCGRKDEAVARYQKVLELSGNDETLESRAARENLEHLGAGGSFENTQTPPPASSTEQAGKEDSSNRLAEIERQLAEIDQATEALKEKYAAADEQTQKELLTEFTRLKKEKSSLLQEKIALGASSN